LVGTGAVFTFTKVIVLFFKKMSFLDDCDAEVVRSPTKCETGARSFEERESSKWRKTTIASGDYVADTATRYNMQIFVKKTNERRTRQSGKFEKKSAVCVWIC